MAPLPFRFGSECYTWVKASAAAPHAAWLAHMIELTAQAGMEGIEPIHSWMDDLREAAPLATKLERNGVLLAAVALVLPWNEAEETEREREEADRVIELLTQFPGALLCTIQAPTNRERLEERRLNLVANVNAVSRRAAEQGVRSTFHPTSQPTSINRTAEDYEIILGGLDREVTGWTPDVGHIINGGMDPLATMQRWQPLINHVHFRDWDGKPDFAILGSGKVDLIGVARWLLSWNYRGWIICEDEAAATLNDPDGVTLQHGRWIRDVLRPALT